VRRDAFVEATVFRSLFAALHRRFGPASAPDRRELLRAATAGTASWLLGASLSRADEPRPNGKNVLIVGAGLAGLAAAHEMRLLGYEVLLLEARKRLGGRVITFDDLTKGKVVEGGGEFIGANHPLWLAYANRFGLQLHEVEEEGDLHRSIRLGGKRLPSNEARRLWKEMQTVLRRMNADAAVIDATEPWKSANADALDRKSMAGWIAAQDCSPLCREALTVEVCCESGVHPAWLSYLGVLAAVKGGGLEKFWTDTEQYHCRGGNQQLADKLAESVGTKRILPESPVAAIRVGENSATVTLSSGKVLEADDVILTAPPTTWRRIAFDPPLPGVLVPQMGRSVKFLIALSGRFWAESRQSADSLSDGPTGQTWEATAGQKEGAGACLTLFAGANAADLVREWAADQRERNYLAELEALFPGVSKQEMRTRFVDWPSDPWTGGGFSAPAPGQVTTMGPLLHRGLGRLHFAGEHTCYAFHGYMEGALQSGVTVARRVARRDGVLK
jgi:monoamine oxidase